jgi:NAD(P)H-dependent FMN reductase
MRVVGLGGSLRVASTSRTALQAALEGAAASGADVDLIWVRDLGLPLYTAEHAIPVGAHEFADSVYRADAMIWSSPTYHGSISGAFKNALDWLILLAERTPPYLSNKPIGLVATAGGVQGLQAVNSMDFIARAAARAGHRGRARRPPVPGRGHLRLRRQQAVRRPRPPGRHISLLTRPASEAPPLTGPACVAGGQCESSAGRPQARGLPRRVAFAADGCLPALDTGLPERRDHVVGG